MGTLKSLAMVVALGTVLGAAHAREPVIEKIRATGKIVLGYAEGSPPFSFVDKAGNPSGFSLDLCRAIAEQARRQLRMPNLEILYIPVASDGFPEPDDIALAADGLAAHDRTGGVLDQPPPGLDAPERVGL